MTYFSMNKDIIILNQTLKNYCDQNDRMGSLNVKGIVHVSGSRI